MEGERGPGRSTLRNLTRAQRASRARGSKLPIGTSLSPHSSVKEAAGHISSTGQLWAAMTRILSPRGRSLGSQEPKAEGSGESDRGEDEPGSGEEEEREEEEEGEEEEDRGAEAAAGRTRACIFYKPDKPICVACCAVPSFLK
eukprot:SAG31_NODE_4164_length_3518_cov_6.234864_2_plen_143_part_00